MHLHVSVIGCELRKLKSKSVNWTQKNWRWQKFIKRNPLFKKGWEVKKDRLSCRVVISSRTRFCLTMYNCSNFHLNSPHKKVFVQLRSLNFCLWMSKQFWLEQQRSEINQAFQKYFILLATFPLWFFYAVNKGDLFPPKFLLFDELVKLTCNKLKNIQKQRCFLGGNSFKIILFFLTTLYDIKS